MDRMVTVRQQSRLIGQLMENLKSSSSIANQAFEKDQVKTSAASSALLGHRKSTLAMRAGRVFFGTDTTRSDHVQMWWPSNFNS